MLSIKVNKNTVHIRSRLKPFLELEEQRARAAQRPGAAQWPGHFFGKISSNFENFVKFRQMFRIFYLVHNLGKLEVLGLRSAPGAKTRFYFSKKFCLAATLLYNTVLI